MNKNTNRRFEIKYYNYLVSKNLNKGFTLIELLVVVIIIGVLAAIALPNLLDQVAKGRQAEAKTNLGALNRAQQAYRLEATTFAEQSELPVKVSWQFYKLLSWEVDPLKIAIYNVKALPEYEDDILDYDGGVSQNKQGKFNQVICEEQFLNSNNNADPYFVTVDNDLDADFAVICDDTSSQEVR